MSRPAAGFFFAAAAGGVLEVSVLAWSGDRMPLSVAAAVACVAGGLLASLVSPPLPGSADRAFVVGSTAILTGFGVALLEGFPEMPAVLAWAVARVAVHAGWSRPLQGRGMSLARIAAR